MSGYADAAFRAELRRLGGAGLACTELVSPRKLIEDSEETGIILARPPGDRPLGVHLYGSEEPYLLEAARRVLDMGFDLLDFNLGCPVRKVTRKGGGAALLERPEEAARLTGRLVEVAAGRVPVTAKIRLGPDRGNVNAPELGRLLVSAGVAALTVHGRTADEGYDVPADPEAVRAVVEAAPSIPVFANGDVDSPAAARRMLESTGAAGLAIGRAALADPWVFARIAADLSGQPFREPTRVERVKFMTGHFWALVALRGGEMACRSFRKWCDYYGPALGLSEEQRAGFSKLSDGADVQTLARQLLAAEGIF